MSGTEKPSFLLHGGKTKRWRVGRWWVTTERGGKGSAVRAGYTERSVDAWIH